MISGKRVYSRRVFVVHGVLLCAVLASAYVSVRAQYEALRDQQLEEARTEVQQATRVSALTLQSDFKLLLAALSDADRAPADAAANGWLSALGVVDRATGRVRAVHRGTAAAVADLLKHAPWLRRVDAPVVALVDDQTAAIAVPGRAGEDVAVGLISAEAVAADLLTVTQRSGSAAAVVPTPLTTRTAVVDDRGRVVASTSATAGSWVQQGIDGLTGRKLNELLASGNAGSELLDTGGKTLLGVQPFVLTPGVRWSVVSVRADVLGTVSRTLRPLFWQLLSQTALMLAAVAVVLVSTTVSLTRGRRRIEKLRTDMLNRDLQKARRIQLNWLPAPQFEGRHVHIAAENLPALHISGDFYNWFDLPAEEGDRSPKTVVVIGDVSGHGMPAAFLMATTQLLVRNTMPRVRDPGLCLAEINRQLSTLVYNGQFVTMMILVIDHDTAGLQIASAGHHPPLLKRDGRVESLAIDPQLVIGVDDTTEYQTHRLRTRPGDALLLFTDGAIEDTNVAGDPFGSERLSRSFSDAADAPCETLKAITGALVAFRGEKEAEDDLTLIAVQMVQADVDDAVASSEWSGKNV